MKRTILDTNIYGVLSADSERLEIVEKLKVSNKIIIYGFKVIRSELRDTSKSKKIENRNLRIDLLNLYDSIVEEHILEFNNAISKMAENYFKAYREFGGNKPKDTILNDFIIVSAASLNNMDMVISNDEKSMSAETTVRAYNLINSVVGARTPKFLNYNHFKKLLGGDFNEFH